MPTINLTLETNINAKVDYDVTWMTLEEQHMGYESELIINHILIGPTLEIDLIEIIAESAVEEIEEAIWNHVTEEEEERLELVKAGYGPKIIKAGL